MGGCQGIRATEAFSIASFHGHGQSITLQNSLALCCNALDTATQAQPNAVEMASRDHAPNELVISQPVPQVVYAEPVTIFHYEVIAVGDSKVACHLLLMLSGEVVCVALPARGVGHRGWSKASWATRGPARALLGHPWVNMTPPRPFCQVAKITKSILHVSALVVVLIIIIIPPLSGGDRL